MQARARTALPWIYGLGLVWLNAYLVRHVFFLSYTGATHSMHGYWMALGRVMGDSWWRPQWVPFWAGGMPSELTYSPLVPWLGWHVGIYAVLALAFVAGPVALYWMALSITGKPGWSFAAGVAYSLVSPTELIQPDAAFQWARFLEPRRMYVTLIWDEAPHQLALAFVCVAVGAWARGRRGVAIGAIVLAALANPFGVTGALLFGLCWVLVTGNWKLVGGTGFLGYLIVCPFYPPSLLGVLRANGALAPESVWTGGSWAALGIVGLGTLAIGYLTRRWTRPCRFSVLAVWVMSTQPILFYRWNLHFLQQPGRYKSEMELALVLLAVLGVERLIGGRLRYVLAGIGVLIAAHQVVQHRRFAKEGMRQATAADSIEYQAAMRIDGTVFAAGSLAHWMNAFRDIRQYTGGSFATTPNTVQQRLVLELTGERSWEKFVLWMQAVGVDSVLLPGRKSPEFWKPFAVDVLAGHLPVLWEERDTRLYQIPRRRATMVHAVPGMIPLEPYVAAIENPGAPALDMHWDSAGQGTVTGMWRPADMVLVHMNYDRNWKAFLDGKYAPTGADGLGQLVIVPGGTGKLELIYDPGWTTRIVSIGGLILAVLWAYWHNKTAAPTAQMAQPNSAPPQ